MSTVQALFEIYKTLPVKAKKELKRLIESEKEPALMEEIRDGLREIKAIKAGKVKATDLGEFIKELKNER